MVRVVNLPAGNKRPTHRPLFSLAIGAQPKCAFVRSHQRANSTHRPFPLEFSGHEICRQMNRLRGKFDAAERLFPIFLAKCKLRGFILD
jgi:hypothetical protein